MEEDTRNGELAGNLSTEPCHYQPAGMGHGHSSGPAGRFEEELDISGSFDLVDHLEGAQLKNLSEQSSNF